MRRNAGIAKSLKRLPPLSRREPFFRLSSPISENTTAFLEKRRHKEAGVVFAKGGNGDKRTLRRRRGESLFMGGSLIFFRILSISNYKQRKGAISMDMMNDIAAMSMDMSAASIQQQASISVQKKVMDTQELAAQEMMKMLPPQTSIIDTYA
jgi:aspartokinase-like uncharacterized kinase